MKTKVQFIIGLYLMLINGTILFAQRYDFKIDELYSKKYVQTPEMNTIKQIALSSVNYSTGGIDIRIPLYDIECGDLTLPIYLSYNSTGIKVNEPCGWVGQNWSLHAEPILTRTPRGHIDSGGKCNYEFYKDQNSYSFAKMYLDNNILSTADNMPDEYNFSLLTGGGMFMYCLDGENKDGFVCMPYDDMEIEWAGYFSITDPLGTKYVYGGGVDKTQGQGYVTSWHASSVVAANGVDRLQFQYDNKQTVFIKRHEDHVTVVDDYLWPVYAWCQPDVRHYSDIQPEWLAVFPDAEELFRMPVIYTTFDDVTKSYQLDDNHHLVDDGRIIDRVDYNSTVGYEYQHLSEISFLGNKVTFDVDKEGYLKDIIVLNSESKQVKHFQLNYEMHRDRRYLLQVNEIASDRSIVYSYKLHYNDTGGVARPGGRSYDFWGYNNSDYLGDYVSLVPNMKVYTKRWESNGNYSKCEYDSVILGGDPNRFLKKVRRSDEKYMQCGMLSSIEHPTGALECFEWEANKARIEERISLDNSSVFQVKDELDGKDGLYVLGGLRIKELKVIDGEKTTLRRSFVYGANEDGAGFTPLRNGINYFMRTQTKIYDDVSLRENRGYHHSRYRILSSTPVVPITYYNGASTMYDKVTEYTYQDDKPMYKTVYRYTLPDLGGYDMLTCEDLWNFHVHNYANWFSDHLVSKEVYENTVNGYKIVSSDNYVYGARVCPKKKYTIQGREYRISFHENFSESDYNLINGIVYCDYKDYSVTPKAKLLYSQEHTEYMSNGVKSTTSHTYRYSNPSDVRMTSQSVMRGNSGYTIYTSYPSNINNGIYSEMVKKNMLDYPVEERLERKGKVVSARLLTYALQDGSILPSKIYTYTPGFAGCLSEQFERFDGVNVNAFYVPLLGLSYSQGRIHRLVDQQNVVTNYEWDKNRQYPIREIKVGDKLQHIRAFDYFPGVGMTSETKPNGDITKYFYDSSGRLSAVKDLFGNTLQKFQYKYVSSRNLK